MSNLGTSGPANERTRRSILRIGAVLASAVVANAAAVTRGVAGQSGPPQGVSWLQWLLNLLFGQGGQQQSGGGGGSPCFLRGTTIETASGDRKIEELAVGDELPTLFGGPRRIQWITRHPFKKSDPSKPWVKAVQPIRVARSALAPGVPHADLCLSEWHAVFVDGVLIPVGSLINGTTIRRFEAPEFAELEYFNIKLESHDVIRAEGAPVETLLEVDDRAVNFAAYLRTHGVPATDGTPCAPIAPYGGLGELGSRVRSAISPWLDRRNQVEVIRDRLEERTAFLARQPEPIV